MKKYMLRAVALLCALLMMPVFAGCDNGSSQETEGTVYYTLSFNTNGGTPIDSIQVREGRKAKAPDDPVLDNYIFCRWLMSDGRTWYFDSKTVNKDTLLEAMWIKAEDLFKLEPMPDSDGIMITGIKLQEEFELLKIPSVINGKKVEGIGDEALESIHERHAKSILMPETLRYVGENGCALIGTSTLMFTGVLTHIGESAFEQNALLQSVTLGTGIEKIPYRAFASCTSLRTANVPEGATTIEENAYEDCSGLLTVVLPSSLTTVESSAFAGCNALKTVFFLGNETQLDAMEIAPDNEALLDAKVYFYSETEPTAEGDYWHYDASGSPITW